MGNLWITIKQGKKTNTHVQAPNGVLRSESAGKGDVGPGSSKVTYWLGFRSKTQKLFHTIGWNRYWLNKGQTLRKALWKERQEGHTDIGKISQGGPQEQWRPHAAAYSRAPAEVTSVSSVIIKEKLRNKKGEPALVSLITAWVTVKAGISPPPPIKQGKNEGILANSTDFIIHTYLCFIDMYIMFIYLYIYLFLHYYM